MELDKFQRLKRSIKLAVVSLMTLFTVSLSTNVVNAAADYNLSSPHTYSDLYASIIFSNGNEGSAASANLGFNQIARYPNGESDRYGVLTSSPHTVQPEAIALTRLLATYNEYSWLVSKQSNTDGSVVDRVTNYIWSNGVLDKAEEFTLGVILNNAVFGANIYEAADFFIEAFEKMMLSLDIPSALRLSGVFSFSGNETFGSNTVTARQSKGFIHDAIQGLLDALQIDAEFYRIIHGIVWTFIILGMLLTIMNQIRKAQLGQAMSTVNRFLIRVFVVLICFDGSLMIQNIVDEMSKSFSNNFKSTLDFSKSIVSDTLLWAGTQNLSFSELGAVAGGTSETDVGKVITTFKPTYENVRKINSRSIAIATAAEIDEFTNSSNNPKKNDATKFIKSLIKQDVFSVNEYFKIINNVNMNKGGDLAASSSWLDFGDSIKAGDNYKSEKYKSVPGSVVFLQERADVKNMSSDEIDQVKQAMLYYNRKNVKSLNDKTALEKAKKTADEFEIVTIGSATWNGSTNDKLNSEIELILPYNEISPFKYKYVTWNEVESYIYGAATTNSRSTADYNNYIHGAGSLQNNNPTDGSDDFSNIKEIDGEGTPSDSGDDSYVKKMMNTNSLAIAIYNRFGGIKGGGRYASLSTQSTAFLLQTNIRKDGITYYGYNTSYSKSDKGTPKQGQGITYVRYVIPNTGAGDLMLRASMLGLVWIVTGIAALAGLFYLLKAPVFAAIMKMTISFFSALFTGNLSALLEYLAYYAAVAFSFGFARMGIYVTATFGSYIIEHMPGFLQQILTGSTSVGLGSVASSAVNSTFDTTTALPNFAVICFAFLVAMMMVWPVAELRLGARNARPRRVGLIGLIVMLPYMLAESFEEYLDAIHYKLYGKSKRQTFGSKFSNQVQAVDQGRVLSEAGGKILGTAGAAGIGFLKGGAVGAALAVGKHLAGSALSKLTGQDDPSVDENGNPVDEKGNVVEDLNESNQSRAAKFFGSVKGAINNSTDKALNATGLNRAGKWLNEQQDLAEADDDTIADEAIRREQNAEEKENADLIERRFGVDTMPNFKDRELTEDEENLAELRRKERLSERLTGDRNAINNLEDKSQKFNSKPENDKNDDKDNKDQQTDNSVDQKDGQSTNVDKRVAKDVNPNDPNALAQAEYHRLKYGDDAVEVNENGQIVKMYNVDGIDNVDQLDTIGDKVTKEVEFVKARNDEIEFNDETVEKLVKLKQDGALDDIKDEELNKIVSLTADPEDAKHAFDDLEKLQLLANAKSVGIENDEIEKIVNYKVDSNQSLDVKDETVEKLVELKTNQNSTIDDNVIEKVVKYREPKELEFEKGTVEKLVELKESGQIELDDKTYTKLVELKQANDVAIDKPITADVNANVKVNDDQVTQPIDRTEMVKQIVNRDVKGDLQQDQEVNATAKVKYEDVNGQPQQVKATAEVEYDTSKANDQLKAQATQTVASNAQIASPQQPPVVPNAQTASSQQQKVVQDVKSTGSSFEDKLLESNLRQQAMLNVIAQQLSNRGQTVAQQPKQVVEKTTKEKVVEKTQNEKILEKHAGRIEPVQIDPKFLTSKQGKEASNMYDQAVANLDKATKQFESVKRSTNNNTESDLYKRALQQQERAIQSVMNAQKQLVSAASPQTGYQNLVDGVKAAMSNRSNVASLSNSAANRKEKLEKLKVEREEIVKTGGQDMSNALKLKDQEILKVNNELAQLSKAINKAQRNLENSQRVKAGIQSTKAAASTGRQALGELSSLANGRDHFITKTLKGELGSKDKSARDRFDSRAQEEANRRLDDIARSLEESNRIRERQAFEQRFK